MIGLSRPTGLLGRTSGVYGHLPRHGYAGYLRLVTTDAMFTFWYLGNPYRPGHIFERVTRYPLGNRPRP